MSRRVAAWCSLALYLLVALGLPFPLPQTSSTKFARDLSEPFPCMDSACGCSTAEHCWRHCCCHSLAERMAWAREHHVRPPDDVLVEAEAQGIQWTAALGDHEDSDPAVTINHHLVLIQMLECHGSGSHWLATIISLPPPDCSRWMVSQNDCGPVALLGPRLCSLAAEPVTPPPRQHPA